MVERKTCQECAAKGDKSTVALVSGGGVTTCIGFSEYWDEDGAYHRHDPNNHGARYKCSKGHSWYESHLDRCPSCDYGKDQNGVKESKNA